MKQPEILNSEDYILNLQKIIFQIGRACKKIHEKADEFDLTKSKKIKKNNGRGKKVSWEIQEGVTDGVCDE